MFVLFGFGLGVGSKGSHFYPHLFIFFLYLVLNVASFLDFVLALMGLDLVSFSVLELGLAAVGLDLVSFLSMS
jgi:hypothetical protein